MCSSYPNGGVATFRGGFNAGSENGLGFDASCSNRWPPTRCECPKPRPSPSIRPGTWTASASNAPAAAIAPQHGRLVDSLEMIKTNDPDGYISAAADACCSGIA